MLRGWTPRLQDQVSVLAPVRAIPGSSLTSLSHSVLETLMSFILDKHQNYSIFLLEDLLPELVGRAHWTAIPIVFQAQCPFLEIVVKLKAPRIVCGRVVV